MRTKPGSPPRGRGKVDIDLFGFLCRGITPAWAGKRSWKHDHVRKHGDHPRVGGEKQLPFHFFCVLGGSPPRGRGKALHLVPSSKQHRITPAWAGKSAAVDAAAAAARDHPRVGGEKTMRFIIASTVSGSPPRGRGKAFQTPCPGWRERITPAWAGKSRVKQNQIAFWWDHPRVGGEKAARPGQVGRQPGITPAWAGKREFQHVRHPQPGDHPRVGGEKAKRKVHKITLSGSPPRGRGKGYLWKQS